MPETRKSLVVLIACLVVSHLAWIKFFGTPVQLYVSDYIAKAAVIAIYFAAFRTFDLRPTAQPRYLMAALAGAGLIYASDLAITWLCQKYGVPKTGFSFPRISGWLFAFDVTIGIVLTALAEELIYRRLLANIIKRPALLYVISASVFAALHLVQGVAATLLAFVAGLILMFLYRWSARLFVPVLAHFAVDVVFFGLPGLKFSLMRSLLQ